MLLNLLLKVLNKLQVFRNGFSKYGGIFFFIKNISFFNIRFKRPAIIANTCFVKYQINVDTLEHLAAEKLELNGIGVCELALDQAIAFDPYTDNRDTGEERGEADSALTDFADDAGLFEDAGYAGARR